MIKININSTNENKTRYQVNGLYKQAGKDYKCQLIVYADDEKQAKVLCENFTEVQPIKLDYRTLGKSKN